MSTPLPKPTEIQFYHVVGGIIIRFGYIDALLADMCRILFEHLGGYSSQKRPPTRISERLTFVQKCFSGKPTLVAMAADVEDICKVIKDIDYHRNYIVHGAMTRYSPDPDPYKSTYEFTKVDKRDDNSGYDHFAITLSYRQLVDLAKACEEVVRGLTSVGANIHEIAGLERPPEE